MSSRSFQLSRNSPSSSFRCSVTVVPRSGASTVSSVYYPLPDVAQRTPSHSGPPALRVVSVTLSATMNAE